MKKISSLLLVTSLTIAVGACASTKEQFDFSKKAPDEFAVVTRAPLEMPPNYDLRPPRPGVQRPQEDTAIDEAKQVVFGANEVKQTTPQNVTQGEAILLQKTGAVSANSNIRDVIDQETAVLVKENTSTVDKILGKAGKKVDAPATIVDPTKESKRIIQNKKSGKPVTDGKTPTIEQ